jgi:hypothetical protein
MMDYVSTRDIFVEVNIEIWLEDERIVGFEAKISKSAQKNSQRLLE